MTGVDISHLLIEEARARATGSGLPVDFLVADAHNLAFGPDTYDAARIERSLQHVDRPARVIAEMARVVRTGGYIVAAEPDWETLVVDAADRDVTRSLVETLSHHHFAHGDVGRQLAGMMVAAGIEDLSIHPATLATRSFAAANQLLLLNETLQDAAILGAFDADRASAWIADLKARDTHGQFFAAITGFIVRGRVPRRHAPISGHRPRRASHLGTSSLVSASRAKLRRTTPCSPSRHLDRRGQ